MLDPLLGDKYLKYARDCTLAVHWSSITICACMLMQTMLYWNIHVKGVLAVCHMTRAHVCVHHDSVTHLETDTSGLRRLVSLWCGFSLLTAAQRNERFSRERSVIYQDTLRLTSCHVMGQNCTNVTRVADGNRYSSWERLWCVLRV